MLMTPRSNHLESRSRHTPAIVFGSSVTALGVVRALRAHDVPTHLLAPPGDIAARSSGVILLAHGSAVRRSEDAVRSFLSDTHLDRAVLIACDDDWVRAIAQLMDHDAGSFTSSMSSSSVVKHLLDKGAFARTLEELDIDRPRTFEVGSTEDLAQVDDDELASFFLKPRDSQRFTQEFRQKAFALDDREGAAKQLERALAGGHEMLLQEWISGPPGNHVCIEGFVDRHGRVVGLLARRRIRMYPPRFGNSTDAVTIPLNEVADAADSIRRLLLSIGYHGLFSAEFKRDGSTGRHKLLEVNARPWWQIELARAAGMDLVHMAYLDALGVDVDPASGYRIGRRWVHTFPDLRARWESRDRLRSDTGPREGWFAARHAVFQLSDLRPGFAEIGRVARIAFELRFGREAHPER
jgi:D-aspartate ligase